MREILFNGKRKDNSKWIEGFLFQTECDGVKQWCISKSPLSANDYSEILGDWAEIIPESVGQYTGQKDRNGNKIFDGHVLRFRIRDKYDDNVYWVGKVCYEHQQFVLNYCKNELQPNSTWAFAMTGLFFPIDCEIIGIAYDNPELLEVKTNE